MGHCQTMTKSQDVPSSKFTQEFFLQTAVNTLKNFKIPPYEWRGIGLHIDVAAKAKPISKIPIFENIGKKRKREIATKSPSKKTPAHIQTDKTRLCCRNRMASERLNKFMPFYGKLQGQKFLEEYEAFICLNVKFRKSDALEFFGQVFEEMGKDKREDLIDYGLRKIKFFLKLIGEFDEDSFRNFSESREKSLFL